MLEILGPIWEGRVVQGNAHFPVIAALVAEGVLDLGHLPSFCAGEIIISHCNSDVSFEADFVVFMNNL